MSTSIEQAIQNAQLRVAAVYETVSSKGGVIPSEQNLANLPDAITSIPSSSEVHPYSKLSQIGYTTDNISELKSKLNDDVQYSIDVKDTVTNFAADENLVYLPNKDYTNNLHLLCLNCINLAYVPALTFSEDTLTEVRAHSCFYGCTALKSIDLTFNNIKFRSGYGYSILGNCPKLKQAKIYGLDASNDGRHVLRGNSELIYVDFGPDGCKLQSPQNLCSGCKKLVTIDGVIWLTTLSQLTSTNSNSGFLLNCTALLNVLINGVAQSMNISVCTSLSYDSLLYLVEHLQTPNTTAQTLTIGTTNLDKLTATEEGTTAIENAQLLGWTIN